MADNLPIPMSTFGRRLRAPAAARGASAPIRVVRSICTTAVRTATAATSPFARCSLSSFLSEQEAQYERSLSLYLYPSTANPKARRITTSLLKYGIQEFDKPLCYAVDLRRSVQQTVHKEQICKYDKGFASSLAQGFLSDVYKKQYTSEKIASMTPEEQTPHNSL